MFTFSKEDIRKHRAKSKKFGFTSLNNNNFFKGGIAGILILALSIGVFVAKKPNAYAVMLDGQQIAVVQEMQLVDDVLEKLAGENENLSQIGYRENIEYEKVKASPEELANLSDLEKQLREKMTFITTGAVIAVDGKPVVTVANEEEAKRVIEELKAAYLPKDSNAEVQDVKFREEVAIKNEEVTVGSILPPEKAKTLLLNGVEEMQSYTVKEGDSLWTIARANGMRVEDLQAANPELEGEKLAIDQELNLVSTKPLVNVVVTYNVETSVTVPFEVKVEKDGNLMRGQEKVKQAGANGKKEMVYKIVKENGVQIGKEKLAETIVEKPVPKVVTRGTKLVLASRSSGGTGILSWPLRGRITSPYGPRKGGTHTGMDIDGNTGDYIRAAEDGVVTFSGRSGNYGYMVTIDHGDGLVTRYAHNSKNTVSKGDKVKRGEVIALCGSTGRSTGSHLHFEVLINGSFRNPAGYLK